MPVLSAPSDLSVFDRVEALPTEIKWMIFKQAAVDGEKDIHVTSGNQEDSELQGPVFDLLSNLKRKKQSLYFGAAYYLCGPPFRWILISKSQSHRFLLLALRKQIPHDFLSLIQHIFLPRVSQQKSVYTLEGNTASAMRDIRSGLVLLSRTLPGLKRLDLGLDLIDFIVRGLEHCVKEQVSRRRVLDFISHSIWFRELSGLGALHNIRDVEICIYWAPYWEHPPSFWAKINDELKEEARALFTEDLKIRLQAKSITGHFQA